MCNIVVDDPKFVKAKVAISGEEFIEGLEFDLNIQHQIHHLFVNKPTFDIYTEVDERFRNMINFSIQNEERWDQLLELLD